MKELKRPIDPHEIQWRIQSSKNGKTTVVPYLTNRCVMERFDMQFGAMGWKNSFERWGQKGVKCGISAWSTEELGWVTKYDGADETSIESTKGGFSDSMKRAAVQWGLGRDLYDYPMIQIKGEHKYLSRQHTTELNNLALKISTGQFTGDYVMIGEQQPPSKPPLTDEIMKKIVTAIFEGKGTIEQAKSKYDISERQEVQIKAMIQAQG